MSTLETLHVRAAGIEWQVRALGEGPPVLLLHGFPEDACSWRKNMGALAAAGYRALAPDLKGYGGTEKPKPGSQPHGDYRVSVMSRELGQLIRGLGHDRVDVVGHDWGGVLLSAMMRTCPERLQRVVLVNAPYRWVVPWRPRHIYFFSLPELPEKRFWRDPTGFVRGIIDRWSACPGAFDEEDIRGYVRGFQTGGSITCAFAYYRGLRKDAGFLLPTMIGRRPSAPPEAMILFGAADPIMPPVVARMAHRALAGSRLKLLDGVGHFPHAEAPERFNRHLIEFLGRR